MTSMQRCGLLLLLAGLAGCHDDKDDRPPLYSPVAVPGALVPCDALRGPEAEIDQTGRVRIDGGTAECYPAGLVCTIGLCDGGLGVARCFAGSWRWACEPRAGAEAGQDDSATADAPLEGG